MINHLALNTPYFGILLSVIPFFLATILFEKTNRFFLSAPLFVSMIFDVAFFYLTGIPYKAHKIGGDIIYFFLESAIICFAVPLHKKHEMLVKHWHRIIRGIGIGTVVALLIILTFAKLAQFANDVILSVLPQAATTAIALPVSAGTDGIEELTSLAVILNGVITYALGNKFLKLFQATNPTTRGLALGTSGHTLGVAPAKELGPVEEPMANMTLVLVSIVVVAVVPVFVAISL